MTTPFTSSSTPNPNAPPPGSPPPAMPAEGARTQEERLLAAAGYLGYFTGFWLVVPIVIYVFYRDKSRFVAHHALRAALYHILAVPVFLLSWILSFAITFGVAIAMSDRRGAGAGRGDWEAGAKDCAPMSLATDWRAPKLGVGHLPAQLIRFQVVLRERLARGVEEGDAGSLAALVEG